MKIVWSCGLVTVSESEKEKDLTSKIWKCEVRVLWILFIPILVWKVKV